MYRYDIEITYVKENIIRGKCEVYSFPDNAYEGSFKFNRIGGHTEYTPHKEDCLFDIGKEFSWHLDSYLAGFNNKNEFFFWD